MVIVCIIGPHGLNRFAFRTRKDARELIETFPAGATWRLWDSGWVDSSDDEAWRVIDTAEIILYM